MPGGSYLGGIADRTEGEGEGRFFISYVPRQSWLDGGNLGRGSAPTQCYFMTAEGRAYFIRYEQEHEAHMATLEQLEVATQKLQKIEDKREKRRQKRLERLKNK